MIAVLTTDGRSAPILLCDYCGERISDAGMGAAVFQPASERDELQPCCTFTKAVAMTVQMPSAAAEQAGIGLSLTDTFCNCCLILASTWIGSTTF